MTQRYEVRLTATGEVRDADGNLISSEPVETVVVVDEHQLQALTEGERS